MDLEKLSIYTYNENTVANRVASVYEVLEYGKSIVDNPYEKIHVYETLVAAAAMAWHEAGENQIAGRMFRDWERLLGDAKWFLPVIDKIEPLKEKTGSNGEMKVTMTKVRVRDIEGNMVDLEVPLYPPEYYSLCRRTCASVNVMLVPYSKMIVDVSFKEKHVAPQFIAVLQQPPMMGGYGMGSHDLTPTSTIKTSGSTKPSNEAAPEFVGKRPDQGEKSK